MPRDADRPGLARLSLCATGPSGAAQPLRTVVLPGVRSRLTLVARVPFLAGRLHVSVPERWGEGVAVIGCRAVSPQALAWRLGAIEGRGLLRRPERLRDLAGLVRALGAGPGLRHFLRQPFQVDYQAWIAEHDTLSPDDTRAALAQVTAWPDRPTVAVVVTPAGARGDAVEATRASLAGQIYRYFRAYDGLEAARHGPEALIVRVDAGDRLAPDALALVADGARRAPGAVLFSYDEDRVGPGGDRRDPYFRPQCDPELLLGWNYLGNAFAVRRAALDGIPDWPHRSAYALALALVHRHGEAGVHHLPFVLYHRASPLSRPPSPADGADLAGHLTASGIAASVTVTSDGYHRLVRPRAGPRPPVSLIVCTRDRGHLLRRFVQGVRQETRYEPIELIVIDNGSREPATRAYLQELRAAGSGVRVLSDDRPFNFAAMNNLGVAESRGALVGFMNNDLEVLHPDWLEVMVAEALRPDVGAVGAKLRYPDGTLQHGGVILGLGGVAGHPFKGFPAGYPGAFGSLRAPRALSAVTAACLLMRRDVFEAVGGFDATRLPVAFNDVDLCLRIRDHGWRVLWTPHAELLHVESASRGSDLRPSTRERFAAENRVMLERWGERLRQDPAYNPNLTLEFEDCSLAPAPRVTRPWRRAPEAAPVPDPAEAAGHLSA